MPAFDFNAGSLHHILRQLIGIRISVDDTLDAGVDEYFGANHAGLVGAVQRAAVDGYAVVSGLHDCVLLGVNAAAQLVHLPGGHVELFPQAADDGAVGQAFGRAVIAGGDYLLVFDDNRAYAAAQTGRSFADHLRYFHEILVPVGSFLLFHYTVPKIRSPASPRPGTM